MRILQIIQKPQNRGAEIFTCQLSNHLIKNGHCVKIISVFNGKGNLPWAEKIESLNANKNKRFLDLTAWRKLSDIIKEFNPDVVQANAGDTLKYAVFSKLIYKWSIPIVFRNASEIGRYLNGIFQKVYNKFLFQKVDYIISVSEASRVDMISNYPFVKNRISVIPVGLEKEKIKSKFIFTKAFYNIVHVGGFTFEKNHNGLLKIFKLILKKLPNVNLHLIGDGPLRNQIEAQVKNDKTSNNVIFHGFVNNPLDYIAGADVLILPSIIEGLPGVILEAMFCKTPVVAYNVGGVSEILTLYTGDLIEKGDKTSFSDAVIKNIKSPNEKKILAAYDMVTANFMNAMLAKDFLVIYKEIANNSWNI